MIVMCSICSVVEAEVELCWDNAPSRYSCQECPETCCEFCYARPSLITFDNWPGYEGLTRICEPCLASAFDLPAVEASH